MVQETHWSTGCAVSDENGSGLDQRNTGSMVDKYVGIRQKVHGDQENSDREWPTDSIKIIDLLLSSYSFEDWEKKTGASCTVKLC